MELSSRARYGLEETSLQVDVAAGLLMKKAMASAGPDLEPGHHLTRGTRSVCLLGD